MSDSHRLFTIGGLCAVATAAFSLALVGCNAEDDGPNPKPPSSAPVHGDHDHGTGDAHTHGDADSGHDHGADDGHDHGEADGGHDHGAGDGHDHGEADGGHDHGASASATTHTIGADAFGGRAMRVVVDGSGVAGTELHVEGELTSGTATDALRMWVGSELGTGSRKVLADVVNGHFHAHVMVPAELLAGSALWLEATGVDGERQSVSVPL